MTYNLLAMLRTIEACNQGNPTVHKACGRAAAEIERLRAIERALRAIVDYYEDETERSCYDDADVPAELQEAERALKAAEAGGGE